MRTPSIKTLTLCFDNPKEAKSILTMNHSELSRNPAGKARIDKCYHAPKWYDVRLHCLNSCGGFHGVESIETTNGEFADYLNAGDTYTLTVIYWRGNYRIQSVGDFVESMERQHVHFI